MEIRADLDGVQQFSISVSGCVELALLADLGQRFQQTLSWFVTRVAYDSSFHSPKGFPRLGYWILFLGLLVHKYYVIEYNMNIMSPILLYRNDFHGPEDFTIFSAF